jgi:hypothetical protein
MQHCKLAAGIELEPYVVPTLGVIAQEALFNYGHSRVLTVTT